MPVWQNLPSGRFTPGFRCGVGRPLPSRRGRGTPSVPRTGPLPQEETARRAGSRTTATTPCACSPYPRRDPRASRPPRRAAGTRHRGAGRAGPWATRRARGVGPRRGDAAGRRAGGMPSRSWRSRGAAPTAGRRRGGGPRRPQVAGAAEEFGHRPRRGRLPDRRARPRWRHRAPRARGAGGLGVRRLRRCGSPAAGTPAPVGRHRLLPRGEEVPFRTGRPGTRDTAGSRSTAVCPPANSAAGTPPPRRRRRVHRVEIPSGTRHRRSRAPAPGGVGAGARPWEVPAPGGMCVGTWLAWGRPGGTRCAG